MKIKTLIAICVMALAFMSCKKDPIKGCKTSYATNYNSSAEEDDGSCTYEGSVVFWQTAPVASVNVYLDGVFVGNSNVVFSSAPACGNGAALTVKKDLGTSKSKNYNLTVTVNGGAVQDLGTVTFEANTCTSVKF